MSKKPKVDHEYHAGKDKMKITIQGYSPSKKSRDAIMKTLMAQLEESPDRLVADAKKDSKKAPGTAPRWQWFHGDSITAPYRHLSVTESPVTLPPDLQGASHATALFPHVRSVTYINSAATLSEVRPTHEPGEDRAWRIRV